MSAIVGLYSIDGKPLQRHILNRMLDSVSHRGPDGYGAWSDLAVGVGHRLLWTTPESRAEKQPFTSPDGNLVITADARIDNRRELITQIGSSGTASSSITDSELILEMYQKWGELCPEKLLGDFAFAIWDRREQKMFCARDHLGVKPFYYHLSTRLFAFASEIKSLLVVPEVPVRINELKIAFHLQPDLLDCDKAMTFYQEICRLPPAHKLIVRPSGTYCTAYWSLDAEREIRLPSDDEYSAAFREIFTDAVHCRVRSAFSVGSTLSGGLDSSSITCTARRVLSNRPERNLHTFSAVFPGLPERELRKIDERHFIESVVRLGGISPHYVRADDLGPLDDIERVLWHQDEAVFAPNLYMHWGIYNEARHHGVRVLLDGIDGDSTVSHGLGYLAELARAGKWITLMRQSAALSRRSNRSFPPRKVVWDYGFRPLVPQTCKRVWRGLRGRSGTVDFSNPIINPAFARRVGLAGFARVLLDRSAAPQTSARAAHHQGITSGLLPYVLEIADKAASAFSIEPRYPFCDRRLVEFCLAVPASQKLQQGWTRWILRRAMIDILPDEIRWRTGKANLSPNFQLGLLKRHKEMLDDIILKNPGMLVDYVDIAALKSVYSRYLSEQNQYDAMIIYNSVTLALWLINQAPNNRSTAPDSGSLTERNRYVN